MFIKAQLYNIAQRKCKTHEFLYFVDTVRAGRRAYNNTSTRGAAERMRMPAFCARAGPAAPAGGSGADGGAATDPAGGLLPDAVARDIQALILQTEEVAATGRACQSFVRGNGMTP